MPKAQAELTKEQKEDLFQKLTGFTSEQVKNLLKSNIYFRAEYETYKEIHREKENSEQPVISPKRLG